MRWLTTVVLTAMAVLIVAPGCDDGGAADSDADVDSDGDTYGDADADVDADADADSDVDADSDADDADVGPTGGVWSMGYYPTWQASVYPVSAIEWSAANISTVATIPACTIKTIYGIITARSININP